MKRAYIITSILLLLVISLGLSACSGSQKIYLCSDGSIAGNQQISSSNFIYVCPDGTFTKDMYTCSFPLQSSVSSKEAETKATNFVRGYVNANGWTTQFVNAYIEEGDWYAQIVIAKYDEQSYQTTVKVDGDRGSVSCIQNCDYAE